MDNKTWWEHDALYIFIVKKGFFYPLPPLSVFVEFLSTTIRCDAVVYIDKTRDEELYIR